MIEHKQNKYLAEPFDIKNLVNGVEWVLEDEKWHKELYLQTWKNR